MKKALKIIGFSVLGLVVLVIVIAILVPSEELDRTATKLSEKNAEIASELVKPVPQVDAPPPPPVKSEFVQMVERSVHQVHATKLFQDYEDNEFAADEKYKGQIVLVRGNITDFADTFGVPTLQLETGGMISSIVCSMQKSQKPLLAQLKKGQDVLVVGTLTGFSLGISVDMKNCLVGLPSK